MQAGPILQTADWTTNHLILYREIFFFLIQCVILLPEIGVVTSGSMLSPCCGLLILFLIQCVILLLVLSYKTILTVSKENL